MKLLVVEDEPQIASFLLKGLRASGYEVELATTGQEGTEVLRRLRGGGSDVPVIVLTARGDPADRVEGLDQGADDYLAKPFVFEELLARIRARLRRRDGVVQVGDLELDLRTRRIRVNQREVELTAREFAVLETFLRLGVDYRQGTDSQNVTP